MKILIVDDKAENLYLMERMINKMGYKSVSAKNGQDALEKLNNDNFDMIISDILMPVMDGYQLCKTVRTSKKFKDILFIFYTGTYTDEEDEKFALNLGADKFLRKPLSSKIFLKIIEDLIQTSVVSAPKPSKIVIKEEEDMFKLYSERLVNKLEHKILELKKERLKLQEAEEEIRKRNVFFNNVIESLTYPFIVINVDNYKVILANSVAKSNDFSNDICCYSLTHHSEKPCIEVQVCPLEEVKKFKKPIITEHLHYDANGNTKIVEVHGYPIFDEKGNVIQMITHVFDISERKRALKELQESEKKFRDLYEEAPNAYFSVSRDKSITNCNKAAEKLLGYSKAEILKLSVSDLYADTDQGIHKALDTFKRFLNNEIIQDEELIMKKKNGKPIWVSLSVKPIFNNEGEVIESRSMVLDISDRIKAEQKLKKSEIKYRDAFNRAELYKDLFAHDVNNILQVILSAIQLNELLLGQSEKLEDLEENTQIIKDQVIRGTNLVSNIRKLSQLEETEIFLKRTEICSILKNSINYLKTTFQKKKINLTVASISKQLHVQANELIRDVFDNILINAIKHNKSSIIEIEVKISEVQKSGLNYIKMEFKDNGEGVKNTRKEKIFQRIPGKGKIDYRMGLGLSLVKTIIENYTGEIWVEDRIKGDHTKGSNFILLIPEVN